jgi:hypothetical protein
MKLRFTLTVAVIVIATASFLTSCKTANVAAHYSTKYINANNGKLSAQVPETYELGYAMLALTNLAQNDTSIINTNTPYYNDLITWLGKHKNHKGVLQLNAQLSRNPKMIKNYLDGLYAFKMNGNRFVLKESYRIDLNKIDFKRYALLLQSFYKETNFHEFYTLHQGYYAGMIQNANSSYSFEEAQKTLNRPAKGYQIILSPLTKGYAGTMEIKGRTYSEYIVFPRAATSGMSTAAKYAVNNTRSAE